MFLDIGPETHSRDYSEETAREIDNEIRRIIEDAYEQVKETLSEKKQLLEQIAGVLLRERGHRGGGAEATRAENTTKGGDVWRKVTNLNIEKKQIDLINESISLHKTCCHCLDLHKRGDLTFSEVEEFVDDRGKSCLYRLKQMCHDLVQEHCRGRLQREILRYYRGLHFSRGDETPGMHLPARILQAPVQHAHQLPGADARPKKR